MAGSSRTQSLDRATSSSTYSSTEFLVPPTHPAAVSRSSSIHRVNDLIKDKMGIGMSPDTSQSSSDSQAAWIRLNKSGVDYVPYVVSVPISGYEFMAKALSSEY